MKTEFTTNDLYQAVVLKTAGLPLIRLEHASGKFFDFIFDDTTGKAEEILSKYWIKKLQVDAKEFVENINEIKTRIHSRI